MRELTMPAAMLAAVLLGACGGGGSQSAGSNDSAGQVGTTAPATNAAPAAAPDPCTVLTETEVSAALGAKAGPGELFTAPGLVRGRNCTWTTATTPPRTFTLGVTSDADIDESLRKNGQTAAAIFTATKAGYDASKLVAVSGVGDEAYRFGSRIFARKGATFVTATTAFGDSAEAIAALESLAKTAAAKL